MLPQLASALFLLQLALMCASVDWCNLRCDDGSLHTMCGFEGGPPRRQCRNMRNTMTPSKRADLLHWHNFYRNSIAEGRLGVAGVANMRQMTYYDDLEVVAQKWAKQCIPAHDVCRTTPRFQDEEGFNPGQNFGTQKSDLRMPSDEMTWYNFLEWAHERINVPAAELVSFGDTSGNQLETWSHWTQLVWANSHNLGCAEVVYEIGGQFERTTFCNYGPGGNLRGRKAFKVGPACSRCPRGTSCRADSDYPSLCALPGDPKTREDFIPLIQPVSYSESEILSSSEELDDAMKPSVQSQHSSRGNARIGSHREKALFESVEPHKEPGEHEPKPMRHKEPGEHHLRNPKTHTELGEHEPDVQKHEEPGEHEPDPEEHDEPGEQETQSRILYGGRDAAAPVGKPAAGAADDKPAAGAAHDKPAAGAAHDKTAAGAADDKPDAKAAHDKPDAKAAAATKNAAAAAAKKAAAAAAPAAAAAKNTAAAAAAPAAAAVKNAAAAAVPAAAAAVAAAKVPVGQLLGESGTQTESSREDGGVGENGTASGENGTASGENGTANGTKATSGCYDKRTTTGNGLDAFNIIILGLMNVWFGGMIYMIERFV